MTDTFYFRVNPRERIARFTFLYVLLSLLLFFVFLSLYSVPDYGFIIIMSGVTFSLYYIYGHKISAVEIEDGKLYLSNPWKLRFKEFNLCKIKFPVLYLEKEYFEVYVRLNMSVALKFSEAGSNTSFRTLKAFRAKEAIELQNWLIEEIKKNCPEPKYNEIKEYVTSIKVPDMKYNPSRWKMDAFTLFGSYFALYFSFWGALYILFSPLVSFLPAAILPLIYLLKVHDLNQQEQKKPVSPEIKEIDMGESFKEGPLIKMTNYRKWMFSVLMLFSGAFLLGASAFLAPFLLIFSVPLSFSLHAIIFSMLWILIFAILKRKAPRTVYLMRAGILFEYEAPKDESSPMNRRKNKTRGFFVAWDDINAVKIVAGRIMLHPVLELKNGRCLVLDTVDKNIVLKIMIELGKEKHMAGD